MPITRLFSYTRYFATYNWWESVAIVVIAPHSHSPDDDDRGTSSMVHTRLICSSPWSSLRED